MLEVAFPICGLLMSACWRPHFTLLDHGSAPVRNSFPWSAFTSRLSPLQSSAPLLGSVFYLTFSQRYTNGVTGLHHGEYSWLAVRLLVDSDTRRDPDHSCILRNARDSK